MLKKFLLPALLVGSIVQCADFVAAQAYVRLVSPQPEQCLPGPDVLVQYEAGGMTLGKNAWNLHFALDNEPFHVKYDGNTAKVFKDVKPGTHTVRVWLADQQHRAIQGTLQSVTFSVAYPNDENRPYPGAPMLTYNLPQGEYLGIDGADINLDFMVNNVTLSPGGYQVAYFVDGRRFLVQDGCGVQTLKGLKPGFHKVKIELQDPQGIVVPGPFNSVERTIVVSPDQTEPSPASGEYDPYAKEPKIASIAGPLTMGQPWEASQPRPRALTAAEKSKVNSLTVGSRPRSANPNVEFEVRAGGVPDEESSTEPMTKETVVEEKTTSPSSSVVKKTVIIEKEKPAEAKPAATAVDVKKESAEVKKVEHKTTGTVTTEKKATTATLKLADRPTTATIKKKDETTVTIHTANPNTSGTRAQRDDRNTSGPRMRPQRGDGNTSGSRNGWGQGRREGQRGPGGQQGQPAPGGQPPAGAAPAAAPAVKPPQSNAAPLAPSVLQAMSAPAGVLVSQPVAEPRVTQ